MDNLKSIFENQTNDLKDIPEGHEQRFLQKLNSSLHAKEKRSLRITFFAYAAAASIGLVLFLSILKTQNNIESSIILSAGNAEVVEAEMYFQDIIKSRINTILELDRYQKHTSVIMEDIEEIDISLNKLKEDLNEVPGDERLVDAVLHTYMMKIEALDNIVEILQKNG